MSKALAQGDVVAIPVGDERFAIAKVLYASTYFKDVVLLGCYDIVLESKELGLFSDRLADEAREYRRLMYTGGRVAKKRGWRLVGKSTVTDAEEEMSRRIVAGEVWRLDEVLRAANDEDYEQLSQMRVAGHIAVENRLRSTFDSQVKT